MLGCAEVGWTTAVGGGSCCSTLVGYIASNVCTQVQPEPEQLHAHTPRLPALPCRCVVAVSPLQETSCGQFAGQCVSTTARIIADAACCMDVRSNYSFVRNFTPKPMPTIEVCCAVLCAVWA